MTQLNDKQFRKSTPIGKPVKPKKPLPTKEDTVKIPVPCCLTEERVRELAREEIIRWHKETFVPRRLTSY